MQFVTIYFKNASSFNFQLLSTVETLADCNLAIVDDKTINVYPTSRPKQTAKYVAQLLKLEVSEIAG